MAPNQQDESLQSYQHQNGTEDARREQPSPEAPNSVTNEYVLNIAFWTFLGFVVLEAIFAIIAGI
jgi:hypothetical protein